MVRARARSRSGLRPGAGDGRPRRLSLCRYCNLFLGQATALDENQAHTLILPSPQIASRENRCTWIVELLQDQFVLVAMADGAAADIDSLGGG